MNVTMNCEPMTIIFKNGDSASFERVLDVTKNNSSNYTIYFMIEDDPKIYHYIYENVACVVAGIVDILF